MKGEKGKAPSIQWYYKDWLSDRALQRSKPSTRGIWMNILMYMTDCSNDKVDCLSGRLEDLSISEICSLGGCSEQEAWDFLEDALKHEFCNVEMDKNRTFHIMSRRLSRDAYRRDMWRKQKQNQRKGNIDDTDNNQDVRDMSNSSPPVSPIPTPRNTPQTPQGGRRSEYSKSFLEFWEVCPNKVGKDAAFKSWQKIGRNKNGTTPSHLIDAMKFQVSVNHFRRNGQDFFPNPATWLNQGRWKDEVKVNGQGSQPVQSNYRFPKCGACGAQASNIKRGAECPWCREIA